MRSISPSCSRPGCGARGSRSATTWAAGWSPPAGSSVKGLLTNHVFKGYPEPMRYSGIAMCVVFLLGLLVLPFAPETKDQPLPE